MERAFRKSHCKEICFCELELTFSVYILHKWCSKPYGVQFGLLVQAKEPFQFMERNKHNIVCWIIWYIRCNYSREGLISIIVIGYFCGCIQGNRNGWGKNRNRLKQTVVIDWSAKCGKEELLVWSVNCGKKEILVCPCVSTILQRPFYMTKVHLSIWSLVLSEC